MGKILKIIGTILVNGHLHRVINTTLNHATPKAMLKPTGYGIGMRPEGRDVWRWVLNTYVLRQRSFRCLSWGYGAGASDFTGQWGLLSSRELDKEPVICGLVLTQEPTLPKIPLF